MRLLYNAGIHRVHFIFTQLTSDFDSAWLQRSSHCEKENTETVHIHQIRLIEHLKENVHAAFSLINSFCCPCLLTLCASAAAVCECVCMQLKACDICTSMKLSDI